jgi:5-methylcytosine-specific restriction protein A
MAERLRGRAGQAQRKRRLDRTNGLCEHCLAKGRVMIATVVNHKIPLVQGGPDTDENTENLCGPCDKIETARQFGFKAPRVRIGADGWPVPAD